MAKAPLNVFVIFWLFLAMRPSTTEGAHRLIRINISYVYTTTEPECSGSLPIVKLSTRYHSRESPSQPGSYSNWSLAWVYTGNCSSYQELSLPGSSRYQFGIELTTASSCHCVTITSATGPRMFGKRLLKIDNLWCNSSGNDLCASSTTTMIFSSKIIMNNGMLAQNINSCQQIDQWQQGLPSTASDGDDSNTSVCPEVANPSLPSHATIPSMFKSSSLVASISSSSSFHTTVEDYTIIMATPASYFPFTNPTIPALPSTSFLLEENSIYSSPSSMTNEQSQFNTGLHSQTAHSSLTSPGASPSPTMLFCSASEDDGTWPMTPACTNATSSDCGNNSSHAKGTRTCHCNGTWGSVHCIVDVLTVVQELINASPVEGLMRLVRERGINNTQRLNLLKRAFTVQSNIGVNTSFVKASLQVFDTLHPISDDEIDATAKLNVDFLPLLDKIAISLRRNISINTTNITLVVQEVPRFPETGQVQVTLTDDSYISLPEELFRNSNEPVTIASFFFKNISHVLPGRDPISPVISSTLNCTNCRTSDLSENVTISFSLPPRTKNDKECVFADLQIEDNFDVWSNSGCVAVKYENGSVKYENGSVICSCNHLTHFAILLSPGVETPEPHKIALTVIGQVLVSISLVFLLATIFTYVLHKSLWNMRNYIHVMLCANLFVSQLVFVVGVERTENNAVCSAIAVLLHYMFLVVFMWMLMEGVVLYVALVVVFVKHRMRYIAGFTIASYGIPLVYMAVVVPIGFLVNTDDIGNHYGQYNTTSGELIACWLRYDTHFIWAFIIPVVLIILINLGFLIRALVVMCKHFRRQKDKSELDTSKHWLKVIVSLTVVMGIAWVGNILFFNINLLFIAYIMTAIIACQGIIIFILFVPLSKQVRDAYSNLWRVKQAQSEILSKMFPTRGTNLPTSAISTNKSSNGNGNKHEDNIVMGTFSSEKVESNGCNTYEECEYNKCLVSTHDEIQEKSTKAD